MSATTNTSEHGRKAERGVRASDDTRRVRTETAGRSAGYTARRVLTRRPSASTAAGPSPLRVLQTYLRRDLRDRRVFRLSLVLDVVYGLVNLMNFLFISRVLHQTQSGQLGGAGSYFDFVAVGMAYFLVVQAACSQVASRAVDEQRSGTLEATAALPVSPHLVALGFGLFPILLGLVRVAVYLSIAVLLLGMAVDQANWFALATMLLLGTASALGLGIALAAVALAFSQGSAAGRVFVVGLSFLSGVYFPIALLPEPVASVARVLPTSLAVEGLRGAVAGGPWGETALLLSAVTVVLLPAATALFCWALRHARRHGTLTRG
jgi:ABC-2 type transport system permease protein